MITKYEKHQRDYSILATSIIFNEFFTRRLNKFFPFTPSPMYLLVENGVLYHFISEKDYERYPKTWLENNTYEELLAYKKDIYRQIREEKLFMVSDHKDIKKSLREVQYYMRLFLPIVMLAAYVPSFNKIKDSRIGKALLKVRKEVEDLHRNEMVLQDKLLRRLEKKNGVEKGILSYLTEGEFDIFLADGKLPKKIEQRKKFVLVKRSKLQEKISTNKKDVKDELSKLIGSVDSAVSEFRGSGAYLGKISGPVRVIRLIEEAKNMKNDEILVASMTDPRYLQAMKKAAAFVTDEGGITCHAAIVAREMKKPCIVGTKIATQVLKNGDIVEVDANNGTVKILK